MGLNKSKTFSRNCPFKYTGWTWASSQGVLHLIPILTLTLLPWTGLHICSSIAAMLKIASWMTPWRDLSQGWSSSGESVHMLLRCGILATRIHTMPLRYHAGWMTPLSGLSPGWSSPWEIEHRVERCKHVKSRLTTVYFSIGRLGRVCTYIYIYNMCEV